MFSVLGTITDRWAREVVLLALACLVGLGTVMVFSATGFSRSLGLQTDYLSKHLVFLGLSTVLMLVVAWLPQKRLFRAAPWLFLIGLGLLLLVLVPGIGSRINGARRWFRIGPVSLQPAEFMKLLLPLFLAWWAQRTPQRWKWLHKAFGLLILLAIPLLIALQPDLGTAVLVFAIGGCFLFLSGWPWWLFAAGVGCFFPAVGLLMTYRPYQMARITAYLDALGQWELAQYQVKQSLLSLGAGGLWGTGLGSGLQKLSFLPESHTDFIFAVVGEELGLAGTCSLIGLWLILLVCGLRLVSRLADDPSRFALAGTLLLGIITQAAINVCVVTSLLPPKGISHPLLSYGGSNLLAVLLSFGLFLNLTRTSATQKCMDGGKDQADFESDSFSVAAG